MAEEHNPDTDQELMLHQTTQSLLMASSMMFVDHPGGAASLPMQLPMPLHAPVPYNVDELLRENNTLHAKIKELSIERDRLLCEVSNLRLELDMSELKRLPVDFDER